MSNEIITQNNLRALEKQADLLIAYFKQAGVETSKKMLEQTCVVLLNLNKYLHTRLDIGKVKVTDELLEVIKETNDCANKLADCEAKLLKFLSV